MAKYLVMASYTAEGVKGVLKDGGTKRRQAAEQAIKGAGGKREAFYFAFGGMTSTRSWTRRIMRS